jgi:hypoxanthine phosphoribosyltransferase
MSKVKIIVVILLFWIIMLIMISYRRIKTLRRLLETETPPTWYPEESLKIIQQKRACKDFTTTILKMILANCDTGFPTWSTFVTQMSREARMLPDVDCIIGIASGGWLIAQIFARNLQKPCIKLQYSRYNNKRPFAKTLTFFKGNKTATEIPDWTTENHKITMSCSPEHLRGKVCLLVDDSIGSGATINVCKSYLEGCQPARVFTYIVCASKPGLADMCYTNQHFIVFPWGFDV